MNFALIFVSAAIFIANVESASHLLYMSKDQFLVINQCVSNKQSEYWCNLYENCEDTMPKWEKSALLNCSYQYESLQVREQRCQNNEKMYPSQEIPSQIFDCISEFTPEELSTSDVVKETTFEFCLAALGVYCELS